MSQPSCDACSNLREYNAQFIMNGVTDTVAASLANDEGFNPCLDTLHTDCEDLNDANDCLLGHMDDDVDNFEVCDWKDFMHNLLPNLYEVIKAIIATICGLWVHIHKIESDICNIVGYERGITNHTVLSHPYTDKVTMNNVWFAFSFMITEELFPKTSCDSDASGSSTKYRNMALEVTADVSSAYEFKLVNIEDCYDKVAYFTKADVMATGITEEEWNTLKTWGIKSGTYSWRSDDKIYNLEFAMRNGDSPDIIDVEVFSINSADRKAFTAGEWLG